MEFLWLIMVQDTATGAKFPLVGYELEKDANDDLMNRADDEYHTYHIESVPFYKK